jgi:uncharacterized protein (TIGR03382 family)
MMVPLTFAGAAVLALGAAVLLFLLRRRSL